MKQKYYRHPWTEVKVTTLIEKWPHWGTAELARELELSWLSVKSKVDKLGLTMLPKNQRLCLVCRIGYQSSRVYGLKCRECFLSHRQKQRSGKIIKIEDWMRLAINTAKHRSKVPSDIDLQFMLELWHKQQGKCFYSGLDMVQPIHGAGRSPHAASIDQVSPAQGYTKNNVVWACWICNAGKNDLKFEDYIQICKTVVDKHITALAQPTYLQAQQELLRDTVSLDNTNNRELYPSIHQFEPLAPIV